MVPTQADVDGESKVKTSAAPTVEWVELARSGDGTAFHRLVDHFQPEIFRMVYYRTRSRMDAEDITQEVLLQAYKHIRSLKSAKVFRSWLYRIAINRVKDYYRKKKLRSLFGFVPTDAEYFNEPTEMTTAPEAEEGISRKAFWQKIEQLLTDLSRMEKEIFLLRFFDQLAINEMSAILQKNESTIKTHLYRALRKVKAAVQDGDDLMEGM